MSIFSTWMRFFLSTLDLLITLTFEAFSGVTQLGFEILILLSF